MINDEHDDLWRLLGKARQPEISPFFARNVLRQIRLSEQERPVVFSWFRRKTLLAAAGGVAVVLLSLASFQFAVRSIPNHSNTEMNLLLTQQGVDLEAISNLDELLAYEENNPWLDDSTY
jgi:hypothetical protein